MAADAAGLSYYQLAERNTLSFQKSLIHLNSVPDIFLPTKPSLRSVEIVLEVFRKLYEKGVISEKIADVPYDSRTGQFKVDAFVQGGCPNCGEWASGMECEECGTLVCDTELTNPTALDGHPLERRPLKRLFLDLAPFRDAIESFATQTLLPIHAKLYLENLLSKELPEVCISNPIREGVPIPIEGYDEQRFNSVMEYVPRHLIALEKIKQKMGCPALWNQIPKEDFPELNILFGTDNLWRLPLISGVFSILDLKELIPKRIFINHMMTLNGSKFSTSRNKAIWVNDIAQFGDTEALRFYLCRHRPEGSSEDFSLQNYRKWKEDFWDRQLSQAIATAEKVIWRVAAGELPEAGQWSFTDLAFFTSCQRFNNDVRIHFDAVYPDSRHLVRIIEMFIDKINQYATSAMQIPLSESSNEAFARSSARLMAFALIGLCVATYPLIPRFSILIAKKLGLDLPKMDWLSRDWIFERISVAPPQERDA